MGLALLLVAFGGVPTVPSGDDERSASATTIRTSSATSSLHAHTRTAREGTAAATARTSRAASEAAATAHRASGEARAQTTFARPVRGHVTSGYGRRWGRMHHGMDFGAPHGAALRALGAGRVITTDYNSGLGHHVRIRLVDGTVVTYGHMSRIAVRRGQRVDAGARLGDVGNSGNSTGAHLHLEVRTPQGTRIDPRPWLAEHDILRAGRGA